MDFPSFRDYAFLVLWIIASILMTAVGIRWIRESSKLEGVGSMKARMLREEEITHPNLKSPEDVVAWRAKLDREEISPQEWREGMFLRVKEGTVIDHPHAFKLVQLGMAEPHDQECMDRCKRLQIDPVITAEAQDRVRTAQLTGDPAFDRSDEAEFEPPTSELSQKSTIVIPSDVLAVKIDPPADQNAS